MLLAIEIEKSEKKSKREERGEAGCYSISDGEVHDKLFDLFLFCFLFFLIFLKRFEACYCPLLSCTVDLFFHYLF